MRVVEFDERLFLSPDELPGVLSGVRTRLPDDNRLGPDDEFPVAVFPVPPGKVGNIADESGGEVPAVREVERPPVGRSARASDEDRRPGRLDRTGRHLELLDSEELALVGGRPGRQQRVEEFEVLGHPCAPLLEGDAHRVELLPPPADAESELRAPLGDDVKKRHLAGQSDRVRERQLHDRRREPDGRGPGGEGRQPERRRRPVPARGEPVVFREVDGVEAVPFGQFHLFEAPRELRSALRGLECKVHTRPFGDHPNRCSPA